MLQRLAYQTHSLMGLLDKEVSKPLLPLEAECGTLTLDQFGWASHKADKRWRTWRTVWEWISMMSCLYLRKRTSQRPRRTCRRWKPSGTAFWKLIRGSSKKFATFN